MIQSLGAENSRDKTRWNSAESSWQEFPVSQSNPSLCAWGFVYREKKKEILLFHWWVWTVKCAQTQSPVTHTQGVLKLSEETDQCFGKDVSAPHLESTAKILPTHETSSCSKVVSNPYSITGIVDKKQELQDFPPLFSKSCGQRLHWIMCDQQLLGTAATVSFKFQM